ncbi:MAG: hypothetical protein KUG79_04040 [Pseudomonadales bacterium]|nr:hypothetical protein [Pseudomonadales bacterium]
MRVTMVDLNKKANAIINQVAETGETTIVYKHGEPIAEIRPYHDPSSANKALEFLLNLEPVPVADSPESILEQGRRRGI